MNAFSLLYMVSAIIAGCFYAWLYTKSGKKWLEEL
jgi:membrane protease YdiL (CAAX protease family)